MQLYPFPIKAIRSNTEKKMTITIILKSKTDSQYWPKYRHKPQVDGTRLRIYFQWSINTFLSNTEETVGLNRSKKTLHFPLPPPAHDCL